MNETKVVNIKLNQKYDIFIGRRRGTNEHFGNPFTHNQDTLANVIVGSREESVRCCKEWLNGDPKWAKIEPERRQWILNNLCKLKGQRLGCFCSPSACHGDVLKKLVEIHCKSVK